MLSVMGATKSFALQAGAVQAVDDVTFQVAPAQCYALLGPSGCGKTTMLRCIAGLEQAERGRIEIGNRVVSDPAADVFVPVHARSIGMVFQSYAIWPHLDVFENVAYPLRVQRPRLPRDAIMARVMEVLALVGMEQMADRPAPRLSGGQQQRVALARAIVRRPTLLLLDEPLSNLDARLRESMRKELSTLIRQIGITALFVTHDQVEALSIADRVAVMNGGRIVQEGAPAEIYERPNSVFVARFLGAANVLPGRVEARDGDKALVVLDGGHKLALVTDCRPGEPVNVVLRPEHLGMSRTLPADLRNTVFGTIASFAFQGGHVEYDIDLTGGARLRAHAPSPVVAQAGQQVCIKIDAGRTLVFRPTGRDDRF
jgi:ABC-type Fe3+/spermidine/putrescine transport system ATPase subunit